MSIYRESYLKRFYDKLYETLLFDKKLKQDSVLISFLEIKSNHRYRALESTAISAQKIPEIILMDLKRSNFIRPSDEINKYTITAKGVWEIEKKKTNVTEDLIVDYIDKKFFNVHLSNKSLSDREKIIIFSMISARTFSEESPIDLKKDEYALDAWKRIIDHSYAKLYEMKQIKKMSDEEIFGKQGNEHKVSHFIRHTDSLPKKTKGVYKAKGKQKYYLDLYSKDSISKESLSYLFNIIFSKTKDIQAENVKEIYDSCLKIAYEEALYIYDIEKHLFTSPEYDDVIRDAIRDAILL